MKISIAEAAALIAAPKQTVLPMEWAVKPRKSATRWYQYETACWLDNAIREDLYFRAVWRGEYPETKPSGIVWKQEYISCGIFAANNRILGIDFYDSFHKNAAGTGLPFAGQIIRGAHIHRWTEYADRYAEPLSIALTEGSLAAIIKELCRQGNLSLTGGFIAPPSEQLPLF